MCKYRVSLSDNKKIKYLANYFFKYAFPKGALPHG